MANFTVNGLHEMGASIEHLAGIPDGDLLDTMVLPAAAYLVTTMREKAGSMMNVITGSLMNSVKITGKGSIGVGVFADVGPDQGKHPRGARGLRHRKDRGGGGGHYAGTNAEIAFIHEYGTTRTPAVHWMEAAVTDAEDAMSGIMEAAFDALVAKYFGGS